MSEQTRIVAPGPDERSVRSASGAILQPPADWVLVPPGDAALTRRIKAAGPSWSVQQKRGRKTFSQGLWAPRATVELIQSELAAERAAPAHARRQEADRRRRERRQAEYVEDFQAAVRQYLAFAAKYAELADRLARAVTAHATPVGSGTVARTQRIPVEQRAEAAVLAWLRHQTTTYDQMKIPRVRGQRREVRRLLAQQSRVLLDAYRKGQDVDAASCPLQRALQK
jgi:hypothetical protein